MAGSKCCSQEQRKPTKNSLNEHARYWKNNDKTGFLEPLWPRLPDEETMLDLAVPYLPLEFSADHAIAFISGGVFHRAYCISSGYSPNTRYVMRVAIPSEPFFKTESEVATMGYVRQHTSLPVPWVIAYDSSTSNPLGFEWILMEMVMGVTLESVWGTMDLASKVRFTEDFAHYMRQLLGLRFTLLGNIYFGDIWNEAGSVPLSSLQSAVFTPAANIDIGMDGGFVIGRMVSTRFSRDKRALLRTNRGPYQTAQELAVAEATMLGRRINHLTPVPGTHYYCDSDKRLLDNKTEVLQVFEKLDKVTPHIFSGLDGPEDVKILWHDDLSRSNILVDPLTFKVTGVIDWESVSIVPAWEAGDAVPSFLRQDEVVGPPPLGRYPKVEGKKGRWAKARVREELAFLRQKYTEIVGPLYEVSSVDKDTIARKRELSDNLATFEDTWETTKHWLQYRFPY